MEPIKATALRRRATSAAGRLAADEYAAQLRRHPSAAHAAAGAGGERSLLLLFRRAVHPGLSDRRSTSRASSARSPPATCKGAAHDILKQNIMGAVCARVCPTEVLCEGACVRNSQEHKPVADRRVAASRHRSRCSTAACSCSRRGPSTGKRVAVVGGGPAGLVVCASARDARSRVTVFEARPKLGGLNEYGVAAYKVTERDRAARSRLPARDRQHRGAGWTKRSAATSRSPQLRRDYDAVFLGVGLGARQRARRRRAADCPACTMRSSTSRPCVRPKDLCATAGRSHASS